MTKSPLNVINTFKVNTIIWFRSLPDEELGPSSRMAEDIEILARVRGHFQFEEIVVGSAGDLIAALSSLAERCRGGLRPLLHFDCHGSKKDGLLFAPAGDFLCWSDLAAALREVNIAAENNVCCIFGVCFGMHLSTALSITKPTPYFLTIAPEREIGVGVLEALFPPFYEHMLESESITDAYKAVLKPALGLFQCEELFVKALATYLDNHTRGAQFHARRERLVSKFFVSRHIASPTSEQLRRVRAHVKSGLKFNQADYDRLASTFLINRQPNVSLENVKELSEVFRKRREARDR